MSAPHDDNLPTGTFTFLFTDIQGSTRLWEQYPDAMRAALARHDALVRGSIESHGGHVFKTAGDAFYAAFADAETALAAALHVQIVLHPQPWSLPEGEALRVRAALHMGKAERRDGDYFGAPLSRTARLLGAAHGGQTLVSETLASLLPTVPAGGASLRSLGRHRLKDLAQPQQIFQLTHPALPRDFPPLRSLEMFTHNLPIQLSSFVGREKETDAARRMLAQTRLLTLTGTGGAGKTRLALQLAAEVIEDFPDGVWLVELAPLTDPTLLPQTVAAVLGLAEEGGDRTLAQTLADALRLKSLLLIWDNCEHLVDACAHLAESLLRACPGLRLLATSREALEIAGETVLPISSLALPPAPPLPPTETLAGYESVRLFVERATTALPAFRLSDGNAPAVAQVCARLDGIPLALELAAARVRVLAPQQIAARLDDRFRLLSGGSRTALPRQQTLRALIDWSYDLLPPTEKTLLRRLSVFAGGWSLEAAEAVCAGQHLNGAEVEGWEVLDLLARLVAKSLVVAETPDEGQVRYRLLENLRSYARERLAERGEAAAVSARHRDWFLSLAEEAEPNLSSPEQASWLNRLEGDHDNLRAALTDCHADAGSVENGLRLAGALWKFWWMRGYFSEGRGFLERALARSGAEETMARAKALNGAGILAEAQGDYAVAISRYQQSLSIYRTLGDDARIGGMLNNLGNVASLQGEWGNARAYYEQGLAIYRALDNQERIAILLMNTGIVAAHQQQYAEARSLYEESLAIFRKRTDLGPLSSVLLNLGDLACHQKDYASARIYLFEGLQVAEEIGEKEIIALILTTLGYTAWAQGHFEQAAKLLGAATRSLASMGLSLSPLDQASLEENVANVRVELGEEKFQTAWKEGEGAKLIQLVDELS
jgi:predicted ATPase/class 3 adenylate cyclase